MGLSSLGHTPVFLHDRRRGGVKASLARTGLAGSGSESQHFQVLFLADDKWLFASPLDMELSIHRVPNGPATTSRSYPPTPPRILQFPSSGSLIPQGEFRRLRCNPCDWGLQFPPTRDKMITFAMEPRLWVSPSARRSAALKFSITASNTRVMSCIFSAIASRQILGRHADLSSVAVGVDRLGLV